MLSDFFKLDDVTNALTLPDFAQFEAHFAHTNQLEGAIAKGIDFPARTGLFEDKTFKKVDFRRSKFSEITFKNCRFEDCIFLSSTFDDVEFHDTEFKDCNFWKAAFKKVYIDSRLIFFDKSYRKSHSNVMLGFYQELFRNYAEAHQWKFSLFADIARRKWDGYQSWYRVKNWRYDKSAGRVVSVQKLLKSIGSYAGNGFYRWTMAFGYGPFRYLLWTGIFLTILSSIVQNYWQLLGLDDTKKTADYSDALFYVIKIFSTAGYTSLIPSTEAGLYFTSGLGLLGLAWTGLFVAILLRRFVR